VVALYRESHPALALKTSFAPDLPTLEVDPDQIKRAVLNLVDNAIEAVSGAGEVTVETVFIPETKQVRMVVSDNGVGIPPEDKDKLFLPYFSTKAAGMGLGLAIVHQIVTDHGGSIWVEDHVPKGSRFVIELPAEGPPARAEA
ncbi:MAG: ATP-binding protein, partial [candidate division NC10 bacterium]